MKIVAVSQGTDTWRAMRLQHPHCASEAAAAMGVSKHLKRSELVRMKALGLQKEFTDYVETYVLAPGHVAEAGSRRLVEQEIGDELYPVTVTSDDGFLWASLDGISLTGSPLFESKRWNEELAEQVRRGELEPHYYWQLEQELAATGAEFVIFACSDGVPERHITMRYYPVAGRRQQLTDAWNQFDRDVAAYVEPEPAEPAPTGRAPDTLPALRVEVSGRVTASNLNEFKTTALSAIRSVNRNLVSDRDFADADKAVRWCTDVESRIAAAKQHALSQTADIDTLFRTLDDISAEARAVRLDVERLITRRKADLKDRAIFAAGKVLQQHIAALNGELAPLQLQPVTVDLSAAIRGMRSLANMQDALDTALARGKIAADEQARKIRANVAAFNARATGLEFLFADLSQLVHKPIEDFAVLVDARIATHRAAEAERQERERLADEKRQAEAAAPGLAPEPQQLPPPPGPPTASVPVNPERRAAIEAAGRFMQARADEPATLRLGTICARLGFTVSAAFLESLGFAATRDRSAVLYRESLWPAICEALQRHIGEAMAKPHPQEVAKA